MTADDVRKGQSILQEIDYKNSLLDELEKVDSEIIVKDYRATRPIFGALAREDSEDLFAQEARDFVAACKDHLKSDIARLKKELEEL